MQLKRQSVEAWQNEKHCSKENNTSKNPIPRRENFQISRPCEALRYVKAWVHNLMKTGLQNIIISLHFNLLFLKCFHRNLTGFLAQQMSFGGKFQHLLSFLELWYFNAKVRCYCSLDMFYTVQEIGVGCA